MEVFFYIYKIQDNEVGWKPHKRFKTYEEAASYLETSQDVTSHRCWKIEKIWEWPF